jgi:hypothetical protein
MDLRLAYQWVVDELAINQPIDRAMNSLIDHCAIARPHKSWPRLRDLPYADTSALSEWLEKVFESEPPPHDIRALWFGLFNPVYDGEVAADMYVSGSKRFEPDDLSFDWACDPEWWPETGYAHSEVLRAIYRIAYKEAGLGNDAEYPLCLGYAALVVRQILDPTDQLLLTNRPDGHFGVAVGFDSGDAVLLGRCSGDAIQSLRKRR